MLHIIHRARTDRIIFPVWFFVLHARRNLRRSPRGPPCCTAVRSFDGRTPVSSITKTHNTFIIYYTFCASVMVYIIIIAVIQCFIFTRVNILKAHNISIRTFYTCRSWYLMRVNSNCEMPRIILVEKLYLNRFQNRQSQLSCFMSLQPCDAWTLDKRFSRKLLLIRQQLPSRAHDALLHGVSVNYF